MDLIEGRIEEPLNHWYYAHKYNWIKRLIANRLPESSHLIDVGAGSALFSLDLCKNYVNLFCTAVDPGYTAEKLRESSKRFVYKNSILNDSGDLYLFTDVLEHVKDPKDLLEQYVSNAAPGAAFVITVPALSILWSGHDIFLKHFKRYNLSELNSVINSAGLTILKSHYIYTPLFPVALFFRKLPASSSRKSQMQNHGYVLNLIFKSVLLLDIIFARFLPFGISIIALAEKPHEI
jgi:hypothetical protein